MRQFNLLRDFLYGEPSVQQLENRVIDAIHLQIDAGYWPHELDIESGKGPTLRPFVAAAMYRRRSTQQRLTPLRALRHKVVERPFINIASLAVRESPS
jgi:hypothetical protein